jgi:hypothetical protein
MIEFIGIFLWKIVEIVCEMAKILYYEYRKREDDFIFGSLICITVFKDKERLKIIKINFKIVLDYFMVNYVLNMRIVKEILWE